MLLSDYAKSLSDPERRKYHIKVAKCGGDDPLALSDDQFTNDVGCYPSVDRADINDYLVHGTSFVTREQLKSYKSLEAHNAFVPSEISAAIRAAGTAFVLALSSRCFNCNTLAALARLRCLSRSYLK